MKVTLLAVGKRMPGWVSEGVAEYARRIERDLNFSVQEIALAQRSGSVSPAQAIAREDEQMLARLSPDDFVVALEVEGRSIDTPGLAGQLQRLREDSRDLCLLVGGPDGLGPRCLARADLRWSLSALTFPHPLVRVLLAEQLYRAWSLLQGHPYHRA